MKYIRTFSGQTLLLILTAFFTTTLVFEKAHSAVGAATMIFLQIPPSAQSNGRASVYLPGSYTDPYAPILNPATLGLMSKQQSFSSGFYAKNTHWLPSFNIPDMYLSSHAFNYYTPLDEMSNLIGDDAKFGLGIGYHEVFLNLGEVPIRNEYNNYLGSYNAWERCRGTSFGFGFDYFIRGGIGITSKNAHSSLGTTSASADLIDWGYIIELPVFNTLNKFYGVEKIAYNGLNTELTAAFGYAKRNISDKVNYLSYADPDPTARSSAVDLSIALDFTKSDSELGDFKVFSIACGSRCEGDLVYRDASGRSGYISGFLGDIELWDNLIWGRTKYGIRNMKAWEVSFFEALTVRTGKHDDPEGRVFMTRTGYTISTVGFYKFVRHTTGKELNPLSEFIFDHLDLQYSYTEDDGGAGHPVTGTKYSQISIFLK